jgi:hypothetical protein
MENKPYFDLAGVIEQQLMLLDSLDPQLRLTAAIGEQEESTLTRKDSASWAEMLQLYADADLNDPVLRGMYEVQDSSLENSPLRAKVFRARDEDVEIPYMKIYFEEVPENLRYVEALFREENPLYSTRRLMRLTFHEVSGLNRLSSFSSSGKQKMIFQDSVIYHTEGEILY